MTTLHYGNLGEFVIGIICSLYASPLEKNNF